MSIHWIECFLCKDPNNKYRIGELDIGDNFNKFAKSKKVNCPLCKGTGRLVIKNIKKHPWDKSRRDYL